MRPPRILWIEDAGEVMRLQNLCYPPGTIETDTEEEIHRLLAPELCLGMFAGARLMAGVYFVERSPSIVELYSAEVDPEARGRGLARVLVDAGARMLADRGLRIGYGRAVSPGGAALCRLAGLRATGRVVLAGGIPAEEYER